MALVREGAAADDRDEAIGDTVSETETTPRLEELEHRVEELQARVDKLTQALADTEVSTWQTRVEQLQLQAALGRMEVRDELSPLMERLRSAYEAARAELTQVPELVGEAAEDLRPALGKLERAFEEARRELL